jgi:PhnB protein
VVELGEAHGQWGDMPTTFRVMVDNADRVYRRALDAGGVSVFEPGDRPWGVRNAMVQDPAGNQWSITTPLASKPTGSGENYAVGEDLRRGVMPFMYVDDVAGASKFYLDVLGASEVHRVTQSDGSLSHVQIRASGSMFMIVDAHGPHVEREEHSEMGHTPKDLGGTPVALYLYVDDVETVYQRAVKKGAKVLFPLEDKPWGDRCGSVEDPWGHIWHLATPLSKSGAGTPAKEK